MMSLNKQMPAFHRKKNVPMKSCSRRSRSPMIFKKGVFKNFGISTRKYLHWILFLIMLQACSFLKKKLQRRYFPVKSAKFLKTHFLQNTSVGAFCCSQGFENFSVKKRPVWFHTSKNVHRLLS